MKMKSLLQISALSVVALTSSLTAKEISHRVLIGQFNKGRFSIVDENKEVEFSAKWLGGGVQDVWMLENGNVLMSYAKAGVKEVDVKKNKVVWEHKCPEGVEMHTTQPLKNGNILLVEAGSNPRLLEINRDGKAEVEIKLNPKTKNKHGQFRMARKTKKGTYWVAFFGDSLIREFDKKGKQINEIKTGAKTHGVVPLPNGNILVATGYGHEVKEFNKKGKCVWHLSKKDMKKAGVEKTGYTAGLQRLKNGNTVVSVFQGKPMLYEITKDKKIVWSYHNDELGNITGIEVLDAKGPRIK